MTPAKISGRLLAWTTLLVALAASICANVAEAQPEIGPRAMAGLAPIIVIFASGLLERVSFTGARRWQQIVRILILAFIVAAAFLTSFQHQRALLLRYGNDAMSAVLLPLAIDALILMASMCLSVIAEQRRAFQDRRAERLAEDESEQDEPVDVADTMADIGTQPEQRKRQRRQPTTGEQIAKLFARDPSITSPAIARKLGIAERTAARHLASLRTQFAETAEVTEEMTHNGAEVADTVMASA